MEIHQAPAALTACELILDLLQAHEPHCLAVAQLMRAARLFAIQENAVRVALTRLTQQGRLSNPARGRYALPKTSAGRLAEAQGWLARERAQTEWSGNWLGVSDAEVTPGDKTRWRRHQRALGLRGFRKLAEGFYLRPDNLHGGVARMHADLLELGLAETSPVLGIAALDPPSRQKAGQLWDIPQLEQQYRAMLQSLRRSQSAMSGQSPAQAARESMLLNREAIGMILRDPLLPPRLMGGDLRSQLVEQVHRHSEAARQHWKRFLLSDA